MAQRPVRDVLDAHRLRGLARGSREDHDQIVELAKEK